jgi:hypothetical protein
VLAERDTGSAPFATVVASVPVWNERTLYDRAGDWFAWLDLVLSAALLASLFFAGRAGRVWFFRQARAEKRISPLRCSR